MKQYLFSILFSLTILSGYCQCVTSADFIANPQEGCSTPHTVFFTDQSNLPDTWKWEFGDGSTSTAQNPIHTYVTSGVFTVKLTVVDTIYGCTFTHTEIISIIIPIANFTANKTFGCGPLTVNFTDQSTDAEKWEWDFGDGFTSDEQNPSHTYNSSGIYNVSLTITASNGCTKTKTNTNYIQVIGPEPNFNVDKTTVCGSVTINFNDASTYTSPITNRTWNFGDGTNSSSTDPSNTFSAPGEYSVSLTLSDLDGCSRTVTKEDIITINQEYNINKTDSVCLGDSYTFPDGSTEDNISTKTVQTSHLNTEKGCDSIVVTTIKVIEIDKSTTISGSTITATMDEADYQWINCATNSIIDTETDSSFTASISGDYAVEITYKNCKDTSDCSSIIGLGLMENEFGNALSVFPNPSNGNLVAQLNNGAIIKNAKLYDLTGQELPVKIQNSGNQISLEITQPSGYYLLEIISTENKRARIKILKN